MSRPLIIAIGLLIAAQVMAGMLAPRRESAGIGSLPPGEFAGTLMLGGFRGLACDLLWMRAADAKENHRTYESVALTEAITQVQPHFVDVWQHLAHDLAYNIAFDADGEDGRFAWFVAGVQANARGVERNPGVERLLRYLAWLFLNRGELFHSRVEDKDWTPLLNPLLAEVRQRCGNDARVVGFPPGGQLSTYAIAHGLYVAATVLGDYNHRQRGERILPAFVRRLVVHTIECDGDLLRGRGEHLAAVRRWIDAGEAWATVAAWLATPVEDDADLSARISTREVHDRKEGQLRRRAADLAVLLAPDPASAVACANAIIARQWEIARNLLAQPGWKITIGLNDHVRWLDQR